MFQLEETPESQPCASDMAVMVLSNCGTEVKLGTSEKRIVDYDARHEENPLLSIEQCSGSPDTDTGSRRGVRCAGARGLHCYASNILLRHESASSEHTYPTDPRNVRRHDTVVRPDPALSGDHCE